MSGRKNKPAKAREPEPVDDEEDEDDDEGAAPQVNPLLAAAIESRLGALMGAPSGYASTLPAEVKRRLRALKNLQTKHGELEAQFREELLKLERKFHDLYTPLYTKRTAIIGGAVEPTDEECERDVSDVEDGVEAATIQELDSNDAPKEAPVKGVPEFWATVLKTHPVVNRIITPEDEPALAFLSDVRLRYNENNLGFALDFVFEPNEYFSDSILTKTYFLENTANAGYDDLVYSHAEGCTIAWKPGKNLTVEIITKKQRHKGTKKTRTIKREVPKESFFRFFSPPKAPEEEEGDDEEDEVTEELRNALENDFELGEIFKTRLIKNAVGWFTGDALDFEENEGNYGYEEEDDDDDGGDGGDDDDDDDDDDEDSAPRGARGPPRRAAEAAGGRGVPGGVRALTERGAGQAGRGRAARGVGRKERRAGRGRNFREERGAGQSAGQG